MTSPIRAWVEFNAGKKISRGPLRLLKRLQYSIKQWDSQLEDAIQQSHSLNARSLSMKYEATTQAILMRCTEEFRGRGTECPSSIVGKSNVENLSMCINRMENTSASS